MEPLPWMVVHGATVFRAAAACAALLGLLLGWLLPRALAGRRARLARKRLGPPVGAEGLRDGAAVTVSGRIDRRNALALVTEAATIELQGTIELLADHAERGAGKGLAPGFLRDGDRVRVRGLLQHDPVTERRLEYRAMERRWELGPEGWGDLLLAFEGPPPLAAPSWRALCRGAGASLLIFLALSTLAGEIAARTVLSPGPAKRATTASLIALASPLHRERALAVLAGALSLRCHDEYGQAHLDAQLEIAELRGDCASTIDLLIRHGQLDRASPQAEACGLYGTLAQIHYLRGRFEPASTILEGRSWLGLPGEPPYFGLKTHLLAGRYALAAELSRRIGEPRAGLLHPSPYRRRELTCLAESLDRRAHPGEGASVADAPPRDPGSSLACRILHADADPRLRTLAFLDPGGSRESPTLDLYAEALALEGSLEQAGPAEIAALCTSRDLLDPPALAQPLSLFGDVRLTPALGPPALAKKLLLRLQKHPGRCPLRGHLAASVATFEAIAGDHRDARRWAEQMEGDFTPHSDQAQRATLLRAAVAIYTGDVILARSVLAPLPEGTLGLREMLWVAEIRGKREQALLAAPQEQLGVILGDPHAADPWSLTAQGDGVRLARFLQRHDVGAFGGYLLIAAPELERGRDELLTWYRWGDRSAPLLASPLRLLATARSREAAVEALGDRLLAAQEREVAEAFYRAMSSREIALPLAILDEIESTFPAER